MSRLEVPLQHMIHPLTGDLLLRAFLELFLKDGSGTFHRQTFRVDPGSDITTMPASLAKTLNLPLPAKAVTLPIATAVGSVSMEVRSGILCFKVDGMDQTEYAVPCQFLGDPNQPLTPAMPAVVPRKLLGLSGVVDKLRLTFDGTPVSMTAPHGLLVVEKL